MKTIEEMKSFPAARKNYRPEKVEKLSEEQMKWFRDAKFGMFITGEYIRCSEKGNGC